MATSKRAKKVSHPVELLREVYALKDTQQRLLGIAHGLKLTHGATLPNVSGLRHVLHQSILTEANWLDDMAKRLNRLLGPDAAKLNGGA